MLNYGDFAGFLTVDTFAKKNPWDRRTSNDGLESHENDSLWYLKLVFYEKWMVDYEVGERCCYLLMGENRQPWENITCSENSSLQFNISNLQDFPWMDG